MKHYFAIALISLAVAAFASDSTKPTMTCSLTGKDIAKCCCKKTSDGKLYCTLTKKTIDSCCCKPIKPPAAR